MNIWYALEEELTLTYEEIKPNRMSLTSSSTLRFLLSPSGDAISEENESLDGDAGSIKYQKGEFRYLLEKLPSLEAAGVMKIRFRQESEQSTKIRACILLTPPES